MALCFLYSYTMESMFHALPKKPFLEEENSVIFDPDPFTSVNLDPELDEYSIPEQQQSQQQSQQLAIAEERGVIIHSNLRALFQYILALTLFLILLATINDCVALPISSKIKRFGFQIKRFGFRFLELTLVPVCNWLPLDFGLSEFIQSNTASIVSTPGFFSRVSNSQFVKLALLQVSINLLGNAILGGLGIGFKFFRPSPDQVVTPPIFYLDEDGIKTLVREFIRNARAPR